MKSYEALQAAIAGKTADVAKRLHLSTITVNKWQEPHTDFTDSGSYNPLDRIESVIDCALSCGCPREKALMPVYYLSHRYGLVSFPCPAPGSHPVNVALINSIKEFADTAQVTAIALSDGRISPIEAKEITAEAQEALRAIGTLIHAVKEAAR
jgi:hypothetical protein